MTPCARRTRREFLRTGLAAGTLAISGALPVRAQRGKATDLVTLGRSGIKVTRLAFGTGSFSGRVQRELGQDGFTRLVRYAYDNGIRFFETAESYGEMHRMLGIALKGANETVRSFFMGNMSSRAAKMLMDDMAAAGPVRLRDVDEAQALLVNLAKDLAAKGEIMLQKNRADDELVY